MSVCISLSLSLYLPTYLITYREREEEGGGRN